MDTLLKRFESPDEIIHFDKGKSETVWLGPMTIGLEHGTRREGGHGGRSGDVGR